MIRTLQYTIKSIFYVGLYKNLKPVLLKIQKLYLKTVPYQDYALSIYF